MADKGEKKVIQQLYTLTVSALHSNILIADRGKKKVTQHLHTLSISVLYSNFLNKNKKHQKNEKSTYQVMRNKVNCATKTKPENIMQQK